MKDTGKWIDNAFFGIHYDMHAGLGDTELGKNTTYEHIREMLEIVKPDWVHYDCKGHGGYIGHSGKIGYQSPGIIKDALAIWRQVTNDLNIPLGIHYSGLVDHIATKETIKYANVTNKNERYPKVVCWRSGYEEEYMIPQINEVIDMFDIDGVWVDGDIWSAWPSWNDETIKAYQEKYNTTEDAPRSNDDPRWYDYMAVNRAMFVEYVSKYADAFHAKKPSFLVCSSFMYGMKQPEKVAASVDFLSGDISPDYESHLFALETRTLASKGMSWNLMAWLFTIMPDRAFMIKPKEAIFREASAIIAQGGGYMLYDQPHRSGKLSRWHMKRLAEAADYCRERKELSFKSETYPQAAVLHSESFYYSHDKEPLFNLIKALNKPGGGILALLHNGYSADVVNDESLIERAEQYPLIVIPEQGKLSEPAINNLKQYVENGGCLLVSGADTVRSIADLAGVTVKDESQRSVFVPGADGCSQVKGVWLNLECVTAKPLCYLYSSHDLDNDITDIPAATVNQVGKGAVAVISGSIFGYYSTAPQHYLRAFVNDIIQAMKPAGLGKLTAPSNVELITRRMDNKILLHILNQSGPWNKNYCKEPNDCYAPVQNISVKMPIAGKVKNCYLSPEKAELEWSHENGVLKANIDQINTHTILVVETE